MNELFSKTFAELTTAEPLDIRGLGDTPIAVCQLCGLWAVVNHRYENLLPTTTHTDKKPFELCKVIESPGYETLAYALVGRLRVRVRGAGRLQLHRGPLRAVLWPPQTDIDTTPVQNAALLFCPRSLFGLTN